MRLRALLTLCCLTLAGAHAMANPYQPVTRLACPGGEFAVDARPWGENEAGSSQAELRYRYRGVALTAIHYVHRLMAYAVVVTLLTLAWKLRKHSALAVQRPWLLGLLALQVATGLSNVVLDWPLVAAVLHTGGAAALVLVLTWSLAASRTAPSVSVVHAPQGARRARA